MAVSPGGGGWGASWACRLPLVERVSSAALPSSLEGSIADLVAPLSHSCCPQGQDIPQWQDLTVLAGPRAGLQSRLSGVSYWPAGQEVFLMKKVALRFVVFFLSA